MARASSVTSSTSPVSASSSARSPSQGGSSSSGASTCTSARSCPAAAARPSAASNGPGVEEVAHDDEHPRARRAQHDAVDGARQVRPLLRGRSTSSSRRSLARAPRPRAGSRIADQPIARGEHLRALARGERHVADRGGEALGDEDLRRLARVERRARVHHEPHDDVLLGAEQLEHGLARASEGEPVHAPQIVAGRVGAVLEELRAAPAPRGHVLSARRPSARARAAAGAAPRARA